MKKKFSWHQAFLILIGVGIMIGFARGGLMNSGGLFLSVVSKDLGVGVGTLTLYFSISAIVMMLALPIAGKMMGKYSVKMLVIVSVIMQGGAFAAFGLLTQVWQFYAVSIIMAIGTAIPCHVVGPVLINRWFKKNSGLAMGVMMSVSNLLAAIIQPQIGLSIATNGWRGTYIGVGIICIIVVATLSLLFVKFPSGKAGSIPFGIEAASLEEDNEKKKGLEGISLHVAKKSTPLYALFGFMLLLTAIASFSQVMAPFASSKGFDVTFAGSAMGMLMIGSLLGGLFFGLLSDKIGSKVSVLISMSFGIASVVLLIVGAGNRSVFLGAMVLFGLLNSSIGTMGPLLVSSIFGHKNYASIYSIAAMGMAIGGMLGTPLFGFIFDKTGSFDLVLYLIIGMIVACSALVMVAFKAKESLWKREKELVYVAE